MKECMDALQASVRPLVTLSVTGALVWGWMHGRLSDDAFLGVAGMVIGFWFQMRQDKPAPPTPTPPVAP